MARKSYDVNDGVMYIIYTKDTDENGPPTKTTLKAENNNQIYQFDLENNTS